MKNRSSVSLLLAFSMIAGLFTFLPVNAGAAGGINYVDRWWDGSRVLRETKTCTDYSILNGSNQGTLNSGWYVVNEDATNEYRLRVTG